MKIDGVNLSMYAAILNSARLPTIVMNGAEKIVCYANPAFCKLMAKNEDEIMGAPFARLAPDDKCLFLLDQVYRKKQSEEHSKQANAEPQTFNWSYEVWPIWGEMSEDDDSGGRGTAGNRDGDHG